jgi:hypothetical protein
MILYIFMAGVLLYLGIYFPLTLLFSLGTMSLVAIIVAAWSPEDTE